MAGSAMLREAKTRPMAALFELCSREATGMAVFKAQGLKAEWRIVLSRGRIAWVVGRERPHPFTQWLLATGSLDTSDLAAVVRACQLQRRSLFDALVEVGVSTWQELRSALRTPMALIVEQLACAGPVEMTFTDAPWEPGVQAARWSFTLGELLGAPTPRMLENAGRRASPERPVLSLRKFGVDIGGLPVVAGVNVEVPRKGLVTLLGARGSGKGTIFRALSGQNDPEVTVTTRGVAELEGKPIAEAQSGLASNVVEASFLASTVLGGILGAVERSLGEEESEELVWWLLTDAGLGELVEELMTPIVRLPLAVQRMLAIVRAVASEPKVILAYEPTANLDDGGVEQVLALLRRLATSRALLVATSNAQHARMAGGTIVPLVSAVAPSSRVAPATVGRVVRSNLGELGTTRSSNT